MFWWQVTGKGFFSDKERKFPGIRRHAFYTCNHHGRLLFAALKESVPHKCGPIFRQLQLFEPQSRNILQKCCPLTTLDS